MMDDDSDVASLADSDSASSSDDICLVTPPHTVSYGPIGRRDSMTPPTPVRPALMARKHLPLTEESDIDEETNETSLNYLVAPPMMPSKSDDSLPESDEWDRDSSTSSSTDEADHAMIERVTIVDPTSQIWTRPSSPTPGSKSSMSSFKSKIVNWARHDHDDRTAELPLAF